MRDRAVGDLVRRPAPVTLPPEASVQQACRAMRDHRVGCVVVVDPAGAALGILTGRDVTALSAEGRDPAATPLAAAMTARPATLPPRAGAVEALRLMQDGGFRHLPVVEDGRVVAVVSRGDFRLLDHARLDEETGYWEVLR